MGGQADVWDRDAGTGEAAGQEVRVQCWVETDRSCTECRLDFLGTCCVIMGKPLALSGPSFLL